MPIRSSRRLIAVGYALGLPLLGATTMTRGLAAQAVLRPGVIAEGQLRSGDLKLDDDTYADLWRFTGSQGQAVRITMKAPGFDCYLQLGFYNDRGDWVAVDADDDGAGGTDSQIDAVLPRDGEFTVRANTLKVGETGPYTLTLAVGGTSAPATSPPAASNDGLLSSRPGAHMPLTLGTWLRGRLEAGDETLSDGSPADIWVYQGRRGETLTLVQKSDVVDSYLTFGRVQDGRWTWEQADNNGAGGKDARLVVTLPADAEYWIRPNALFAGKGDYTLLATSDRQPSSAPAPTPAAPAAGAAGAPPAIGAVGPLQQGLSPASGTAQGAPSSSAAGASAGSQRPELSAGQTIRGRLALGDVLSFDTTYIDTYVYRGHRGEQITIIMMSPDFGSYLLFGEEPAAGSSFSSMGHAGAVAGRETRLAVTVPHDGTYWIQANEFDRAEGSYVLTVEAAR